jgi:hypothetical protein
MNDPFNDFKQKNAAYWDRVRRDNAGSGAMPVQDAVSPVETQMEEFLRKNAEWQAQQEKQEQERAEARADAEWAYWVRVGAEKDARADDRQVGGSHYKDMPVQPWSVMEAVLTYQEFVGYLKGNIIKYSMRQGLKTAGDAEKAKHYIEKLAEVERGY